MTTTNPMTELPEPAFRLRWDGERAAYFVSKPNIGDTDVYTAEQLQAAVAQALAARLAVQEVDERDADHAADKWALGRAAHGVGTVWKQADVHDAFVAGSAWRAKEFRGAHGEPGSGMFATPSGPAREPGSAGCESTGRQIDVRAAILSLPCDPSRANDEYSDRRSAYEYAHRDALHAAAELVASTSAQQAAPTPTEQPEEPIFHLRSYGDVTAAQLKAYADQHAQQHLPSAAPAEPTELARLTSRPLDAFDRGQLDHFRGLARRWHEAAVAKGFDGVEALIESAVHYGERNFSVVATPPAAPAAQPAEVERLSSEELHERIAPHSARILAAIRQWGDNRIHVYKLAQLIEIELRALATAPQEPATAPQPLTPGKKYVGYMNAKAAFAEEWNCADAFYAGIEFSERHYGIGLPPSSHPAAQEQV